MEDQGRRVTRRTVFHIPGYDPMPPRRYRELYRKEAAKQARISGYEIALKAENSTDSFSWSVAARVAGDPTLSQIHVLVWSDIVRDSMAQSIPATYWQLARTAWLYLSTGTLRRLTWMRKGPVIAALYPVFMLTGQALLALWLGWTVGRLLEGALLWLWSFIGFGIAYVTWLAWGLKLATLAVVSAIVLRWFKAVDHRLFAHYLMHDYAFSAQLRGLTPPPLQSRLDTFRAQIAAALQSDVDEVLIVGHSSGAHLAVSIMAAMVRAGGVPVKGPKLALLSLGQVIPMVSFLPRAQRLRGDLVDLAVSDRITWVDVTAPGDGCCFALCDPVSVTGVAPPGKRWPLVISAAFTNTLKAATWRALRWRFFRLHFQYLCAFDRPGDYDYFQITAGPLFLADRFAGRRPSGARIDIPVSKYTSLPA
ncbi:MAG: hypothetical protein AAGF56_02570 [Pseudomonadota bacterium]